MGIECKVIKKLGVIANHNGITLELRRVKWGNNPECYDLRAWKGDYAMGGLTLTSDELKNMGKLIDDYKFIAINEEQLQDIVDHIQPTPSNAPKRRGRPRKESNPSNPTTEASKANTEPLVKLEDKIKEVSAKKGESSGGIIIKFPKPKPEVVKVVTKGSATYEDCEKKIAKELEAFKDGDSQYVLNGLLELCKVDGDFRNNFVREDKNFAGALAYMAKMCKEGFGYMIGQYGTIDRDMGLGFAIDYFNTDTSKNKVV